MGKAKPVFVFDTAGTIIEELSSKDCMKKYNLTKSGLTNLVGRGNLHGTLYFSRMADFVPGSSKTVFVQRIKSGSTRLTPTFQPISTPQLPNNTQRLCRVCDTPKDIEAFSRDKKRTSHTCISCENKIKTQHYHDKMNDILFVKLERARRMEKHYRRQKEKYQKLILELKKSNNAIIV